HDVRAHLLELQVDALALRAGALVVLVRDDHDDLERGERLGPHDAAVVVALLDRGRHDARDADAVGAHDVRLLGSVLVDEPRPERRRVVGAELIDVPDDDRASDPQGPAVHGTAIALAELDHILPAVDAEVAPDVGAGDVAVARVGAG